jgi:iron(III) transport system ATP-binding protein
VKDIRVVGLAKAFGKTPAVDHVQFDVPAGSLATLLGPSGCGKTTRLRLLAGLEKPDAGEVYVGGRLRIPAFYALHVWAWKHNPHGMFVDWNPKVSCEDFSEALAR